MVVDGGLVPAVIAACFHFPRVPLLVVDQAWVVIPLVEILKDGREDFGFFIGQRDLFCLRVEHLVLQDTLKEGGRAENILMGGEDPLLLADDEGYDSGDGVAAAR